LNPGEVLNILIPETTKPAPEFSENVQNFWNNWRLRVLVLSSFTLQQSLLYFGRHRRFMVGVWIHYFLWFCYLVADTVATVALSVISCTLGNSSSRNDNDIDYGVPNDQLMTFWAVFMLLHLGGQDTITAYTVQDNDLWFRHLFRLVAQSGVVIYVIRMSWNDNWLSFLTIPMLLAGVIRYAERIWVMRSANRPPKYAKDYNEFEWYDQLYAFPRLKPLFLNQKIQSEFLQYPGNNFRSYDRQIAFKRIEIELGQAYDAFYTKIPLFLTGWGCFFRFISFFSTFSTFVFFLIKERHKHQQIDLIITYMLMGGAIFSEIYVLILLIFNVVRASLEFKKKISLPKKRWSKSMGQFSMLKFRKRNKPRIGQQKGIPKFFANLMVCIFLKLRKELMMNVYFTHKISEELERLVWVTFMEKLNPDSRGFSEDYASYIPLVDHEHAKVEIYQSIIIWHIVTDLCFSSDSNNEGIPPIMDGKQQVFKDKPTWKRVIKEISDYMMYILAVCPFMFSTGDAEISFEKACKQVEEAIEKPQEHDADSNLVYYAIQVAGKLQENERKWEILTRFWVENLAYVAILCRGKNHAKQLPKGGEFLTHVWLLIKHLDLEEKFRMPQQMPV
jgi:hypothetical protein